MEFFPLVSVTGSCPGDQPQGISVRELLEQVSSGQKTCETWGLTVPRAGHRLSKDDKQER